MSQSKHKTIFGQSLAKIQQGRSEATVKRWIYVAYDQLNASMGALKHARVDGSCSDHEVGLIFIESTAKGHRRGYHKQKLALLLTNMRHFALEQAQAGHVIRYVASRHSFGHVLNELVQTLGPIEVTEPAERELRVDLLNHRPNLRFAPHDGWLSSEQDFAKLGEPPWRMDSFYRHLRRKTGILMDGHTPRGGTFSLDAQNRKPWRGSPPAPTLPRFVVDRVTREVGELVEREFGDHFGTLDLGALPATQKDAKALWHWAKAHCLKEFGPFEDAMSHTSINLFHAHVGMLINLSRLLPKHLLEDVMALKDVPLASLEGFVRQILGWREFIRHVHRRTDGLKNVATHNFFDAKYDLPQAYWGQPSGLKCLDTVIEGVVKTGYSHHITRLMVLANIATLMDANPRQLTDWFWIAYVDAYDWVVEPNVMAMGTFATGDLMMTKPYISGAAYIDRMSDFCKKCAFSPKRNCPITPMYWAFLDRHKTKLQSNVRMAIPLMGLNRRSQAQRDHDKIILAWVQETLAASKVLDVENLPGRAVSAASKKATLKVRS